MIAWRQTHRHRKSASFVKKSTAENRLALQVLLSVFAVLFSVATLVSFLTFLAFFFLFFFGDLFALAMGFLDFDQGSQAADAVMQTLDFTAQFDDFGFHHENLLTARIGLASFVADASGFLPAADLTAARFVRRLVAEVDIVRADAVRDDAKFIMPVWNMRGGEANGLRGVWSRHSSGAEMIGTCKEYLMGF